MNNAILLLTHSCTPFTEEKKKRTLNDTFFKNIYIRNKTIQRFGITEAASSWAKLAEEVGKQL